MTGGGVDRSVECTGSIQAMISAFECVHDGWGVAVLVGVPNKDDAFKTHPVNLLNEKTVKGTFFGNYKPRSDIPAVVEKYMNKELELDKFITHTVPFSEINKAFELMLAGEGLRCGWGVAVLVGVPNKDDEFKTHPVNLLNEKTLKGTFFGNYKPRSDIPAVVEKYMNKELELDKFITHTVPFSEINKAFELMLAGEGLRCVIRMDA
ncbi:hypothetical protein Goklo_025009 [Gossypium klotzschianum]|uniref:Alcohol dehydrogenase-like C-terminal domain-containing protein n=1 Tax=Gossypium klotzschianum TaxID=34286 RepID=A0A7J8WDW5_9ROSI|nr:hypothetical protein [Gossypium klotzschianum]